jgi:hypothetical protein
MAVLVRYDAMCHAIAAAYEIDEVKNIRDQAAALEYYARQAGNTEAEKQCYEIRLRAEKKWGQIRKKTGTAQGRRSDFLTTAQEVHGPKTNAELGVTDRQAADWQRLADVPDNQFEAALAGPGKPSISGIITAAFPPKPKPVSDEALWLWGTLNDFETEGYLAMDPNDCLTTMTDEMYEDLCERLPQVIAWLCRLEVRNG